VPRRQHRDDPGTRQPSTHPPSDLMAGGTNSPQPVSAAVRLLRIAQKAFSSPQEATEVLTAAIEAEDYLECIKDLKGHGIDQGSYIDGLDGVSLDQSLGHHARL